MKNSAKILIVGAIPMGSGEAAKLAALKNSGLDIQVVSAETAAEITRKIEREKQIPKLENLLPKEIVYRTSEMPKSNFHK